MSLAHLPCSMHWSTKLVYLKSTFNNERKPAGSGDPVMLVLAFTRGAETMGFVSKAEWMKGMEDLQCNKTCQLKGKLTYLRSLLKDQESFRKIYLYAFDFAKEGKTSLDIDNASAMLELLLGRKVDSFPQLQEVPGPVIDDVHDQGSVELHTGLFSDDK